jgi:glycosyltransferase 2 family protein
MVCYALLFILLLLLIPLPEWIGGSGVTFIGLTLSLLLLVLLVAYQRHGMIRWLDWAGRRLPASIRSYLAGHVRLGLDSLEVFQHSQELLKLAGWSALIWGLALLTNQLVLLAFGIHLPWTASVLLLVALQAGISIPSIPGKIGIFEYICVLALAVFRIDPSIALSYGILLHAVVYLPMLLAGLISFWLLGLGRWSAELA